MIDNEIIKALKCCAKNIDYDRTQIFLGNPTDLLKMDMNKFASYFYFIPISHLRQGELLLVQDRSLKEELYKFIKESPDKVFRGRKDT